MLLLIDIGNTHTHCGIADDQRIVRQSVLPTSGWITGKNQTALKRWNKRAPFSGAAFCSVVPQATKVLRRWLRDSCHLPLLELSAKTVSGVGINYPKPNTIGPDRLANAVAARRLFAAPAIAVDFGTAVTFDVVDRHGDYVGGIIAPGLAAMTEYLNEKTALLPRIQIRETSQVIGRSTEEAMLIGTVHGYRGLIRELLKELKRELKCRRVPLIATGGYAQLMSNGLPEITAVEPLLTLKGLLWEWNVQSHEKVA